MWGCQCNSLEKGAMGPLERGSLVVAGQWAGLPGLNGLAFETLMTGAGKDRWKEA